MWSNRSTGQRVLIGIGCGCGLVAGWVTLKVSIKVCRLLSHKEEIYHWLTSIIPPTDYDYKVDAPGTAEYVAERFPQLLDIVEHGTLTVLRRPADFDRALPDELFILGTAHVSKKTAAAVYRTIMAIEPDAVVVELCKSRAFMMYRELLPEQYTLDDSPAASTTTLDKAAPAEAAASASDPAARATASSDGAATTTSAPQAAVEPTTTSSSSAAAAAALAVSAPGAAPTPAAPRQESSLAAQLQDIIQAFRTTGSPLQALLGCAYKKVEEQLGTVAGLEFILARRAIQALEQKRHQQNSDPSQAEAGPTAGTPPGEEGGMAAPEPVATFTVPEAQRPDLAGQGRGGAGSSSGEVLATASGRVHVYLGDVPLQRTVSRMWGVLSVRQKLRLCWFLLHDCLSLQADDAMLEALLQEDMFQLMQKELGAEFPEAMGPLLHERNWQLAYTVHQAAQHGMKRVVLVVGRGHVPGVVYCLLHPYRMRKAQATDRAAMLATLTTARSAGAAATAPLEAAEALSL